MSEEPDVPNASEWTLKDLMNHVDWYKGAVVQVPLLVNGEEVHAWLVMDKRLQQAFVNLTVRVSDRHERVTEKRTTVQDWIDKHC